MKEFESDVKKLEKIIQDLELGSLSLDIALSKFEEGVKLYKNCHKTLSKVEKKIKILTSDLENCDNTLADFDITTTEK